jgi:hypothetical protein
MDEKVRDECCWRVYSRRRQGIIKTIGMQEKTCSSISGNNKAIVFIRHSAGVVKEENPRWNRELIPLQREWLLRPATDNILN